MNNENKNTNDENLNVKIDTSWYSKIDNEFHIKTVAQFAGLAELVNKGNSFSGNIIYLDSNLDLNRIKWIPIGNAPSKDKHQYFSGIFNGQGHTIDHLTLFSHGSCYNSLFGNVYNGTIQNIGIINAKSDNANNNMYGSLGILASIVENSFILNAYTTGCIVNKQFSIDYIGGLIGKCKGNTKVIGCYSNVIINAENMNQNDDAAIGGLIGFWESATDDNIISDCFFDGKIYCLHNYYIGGILGIELSEGTNGVKINNCLISNMSINCTSTDKIAWIATTQNGIVDHCYWPYNKDTNWEKQPNVVNYFEKNWLSQINRINKEINQSTYGRAIQDFKNSKEIETLISTLNQNANKNVKWQYSKNIFNIKYKSADYSVLTNAIINIYHIFQKNKFTDDNIKLMTQFFNNNESIENILQSSIDTIASYIESSIKQIENIITNYSYTNYSYDTIEKYEPKPLDYAEITSAIMEAERLYREKSIFYRDFSAVNRAIRAAKRGPHILQSDIHKMAKDIKDALASLELKDASYTSLFNTIERARKINKDEYKNFDEVEKAIFAVDYDKKMTEQHVVRAMEVAIENAIKNLKYKDADYSKVEKAIKNANSLDKTQYKNFDVVDRAISFVVYGKTYKEQCYVNRMAKEINDAINNLQLNDDGSDENEKNNK